jgi:hypothetical protein
VDMEIMCRLINAKRKFIKFIFLSGKYDLE